MRAGVVILGTIGLCGLSSVALAQTPKPRVGFQMAIRTGYSVPMGDALGSDPAAARSAPAKLSDVSSGQIPVLVDIGTKVIHELFVGVYFGLGFGGAGGSDKDYCARNHADCQTIAFHFGIEAQYHILQAGAVNPWLGYGLGVETLDLDRRINGVSRSQTFSGFEFARFMAGVDFRVQRVFGVGPFVDLSLASFSTEGDGSTRINITDTSTHAWLTLGARFVLFP
jgi:hypothetical protein